MPLDYGYTCSIFDKAIANCNDEIEETLKNIVEECCPLLKGEDLDNLLNKFAIPLKKLVESHIESGRTSNINMRDAADSQIDIAIETSAYLESDLKTANENIRDLNDSNDELKEEIDILNDIISSLRETINNL